jgi:DNA-binding transcriptional ArsR family regulator
MTIPNLDFAVAVARALGHPARLRTLAILASGELCVCQITEVLKLAPSTVSAHLKELRLAGLISERKHGKWVSIALAETGPVRAWIETAIGCLVDDPRLGEDLRLVAALRELLVEDLCRFGYKEARARAGATPTP